MFAVIFEVQPKAGQEEAYLGIATALRPELEKAEGFISIERFASRRWAGWLLSLSFWRDEKSLIRWRTAADHHRAQAKGRAAIFADYHLRVGEVARDSHMPAGQKLEEQRLDVTETGAAKSLTLIECLLPAARSQPTDAAALAAARGLRLDGAATSLAEWDILESIAVPGKFLLLAAGLEGYVSPADKTPADGAARRRDVRIIRDYGMFDRREAPQYYPPAARNG